MVDFIRVPRAPIGCWVPENNMGDEGVKALAPHLAKLSNLKELYLAGGYL